MDLAIHHPVFAADPTAIAANLAATARAAEGSGVAAFTLMDHYFQMEPLGGPPEPMLEGYTALGYLAAVTERMELGLLVTGVTYRHPGLLAKIVATLDVLSGGRAFLGIGAAWYEREMVGLGVPYPPTSERYERLDEAIRICRQMWSGEGGAFHGEHYELAEAVCVPAPQHQPDVLIGGSGERKTLRLVAQHADASNLFDGGVDEVAHKIEVLRGHCADVGRDPAEIAVTVIARDGGGEPAAFVERMKPYADLGVSRVWVSAPTGDAAEWVGRFAGTVVPGLAAL